ncbi:MAG: M28 family peptidase [Bryobacterales bacterium]|nr:M28 family peptidase [Bryobacterales bacterium]
MTRAILACAAVALATLWAEGSGARQWWAHVEFLAADRLMGRDTGSEGHKEAARYIAHEFERAGLRPKGIEGYSQPVRLRKLSIDEGASSLALEDGGRVVPLKLGEDAYFSLRGNLGAEVNAPMAFAGYGFSVPEKNYDELAGLDVKGKVVVYLTGGPRGIPPVLLSHNQSSGVRWARLREAGAIGIGIIANPRTADIPWARARLARLLPSMQLADFPPEGPRAAIVINPDRVNLFLEGTGHTMEELLDLAAKGEPLPKFDLKARLRAKVKITVSNADSENVVGFKEGSHAERKHEFVILSAHFDHIGVGENLNGDKIYNGAMDNAAGVASLIEVARQLSGKAAARSILFLAVTGEEKGLLGSRYFAHSPAVPREAIAADLNLDMFLPLFAFRRLTVYGLDESTLGETVERVAEKAGIIVQRDPEPLRNSFIRSDQYSFIERGIPALAFKLGYAPGSGEEQIFKTWLKERYHSPSDDLTQPVDKEAAARFNNLMASIVLAVADDPQRPRWLSTSFFRRYAR